MIRKALVEMTGDLHGSWVMEMAESFHLWVPQSPLRSQPFEFFKKIRNNLRICDMCAGSILTLNSEMISYMFQWFFLKYFMVQ